MRGPSRPAACICFLCWASRTRLCVAPPAQGGADPSDFLVRRSAPPWPPLIRPSPASAHPWASATSVHQIVLPGRPFQGQLSPGFSDVSEAHQLPSRENFSPLGVGGPAPTGPISVLSPSPPCARANACCCPGLTSQSQGRFAGTEPVRGRGGRGAGKGAAPLRLSSRASVGQGCAEVELDMEAVLGGCWGRAVALQASPQSVTGSRDDQRPETDTPTPSQLPGDVRWTWKATRHCVWASQPQTQGLLRSPPAAAWWQ